jgi:asparagine synthase (glutamine-hydrolysing)
MLRFLAFAWDSTSETASSEVIRFCESLASKGEEWNRSLRARGLWVFHTGEDRNSPEVHPFGEGRGVILGRIFHRGAVTHIAKSEELTNTVWGRYVAFEAGGPDPGAKIFRGPAGALSCFYACAMGVRIFFSDVCDYTALRCEAASINWAWVATLLVYPRHAMGSVATGINSIQQLQPGESLVCNHDGTTRRTLEWDPFRIASSDPIEDFSAATAAIRAAAQYSIWSWAAVYPRIVLLLSGGLDSSIVLSCLKTAPTRPGILCVNYFSGSHVTGDERTYARIAASTADCRLLELEEDCVDTDLKTILRVARTPVAWSYLLYVRHSHREGKIASETDSSAIFSGTAGDQIFFHGPAVLAAADYLRRHGVFSDFVPFALSVARRNKLSLLSVLTAAARDRFAVPRYDAARDNESPNRLITRGAIEEADGSTDIRHYWLPFAHGVPKGKLLHVLMMDWTQDLRDPFGSQNYPERVHPLCSQPLIEACLRIPTYILTREGWSRGAARSAFLPDLAPQIVSRMTKGYIDSQNADLLLKNLAFVRELLLEGQLVSHGLIDRHKLEQLLTPERVRLSAEACEVLCEHLSYEAWLRTWAATSSS